MKLRTKQKTINKAIELFNDKGFASVTLFEIAGALDMTRGNLLPHLTEKGVEAFRAFFGAEYLKKLFLP